MRMEVKVCWGENAQTLTKREKEAAEASAASESVHHKARQLERHTHEAVEEATKWVPLFPDASPHCLKHSPMAHGPLHPA
jgi:hypothetical protein